MISIAAGDVSKVYPVKRDGETVGIVRINTVVQALVPTKEAEA